MEIDPRTANLVDFPGAAGEHQRNGATAALIRELGDNYADYHAFLARRIEEIGGDPDPTGFHGGGDGSTDDHVGYARQANALQRIAASEMLLRAARNYRKHGRPLSAPLRDQPPISDAEYKLVDVEHPERSRFSGPLTAPPGPVFPMSPPDVLP